MTEIFCGVTIEEQQCKIRAELPVNIREDGRVARHPKGGWIVAYPQRNKPWRLPEWVRPGGSVETMDPGGMERSIGCANTTAPDRSADIRLKP